MKDEKRTGSLSAAARMIESNFLELKEVEQARLLARFTPATATPEKIGYRPTEAAHMTGMSRVSLWRLEKQGVLVPKKVGRMRIYSRAQLEAFLS